MSEHTKGELKYIGSTSIVCIETNGSRRISIATVLPAGVDIDTNCKYAVDFQANAEHLVKCWNCHDELVAVCERYVRIQDEIAAEMKRKKPTHTMYLITKAALEKVNKQ